MRLMVFICGTSPIRFECARGPGSSAAKPKREVQICDHGPGFRATSTDSCHLLLSSS
jgi:hypothetical protein